MNQFMNSDNTEGQMIQFQQMFQNQAAGEDSQYLWQFQNAQQLQQGSTDDKPGQNQNSAEDPGLNNGATDPGENGNGGAQGSNSGTKTNGNGQNGGSGGNGGK